MSEGERRKMGDDMGPMPRLPKPAPMRKTRVCNGYTLSNLCDLAAELVGAVPGLSIAVEFSERFEGALPLVEFNIHYHADIQETHPAPVVAEAIADALTNQLGEMSARCADIIDRIRHAEVQGDLLPGMGRPE